MPSAPGGKWGGVAGVQKLIGIRALRRLEIEETKRVQSVAQKFLGTNGRMAIFQKNAWNALKSDDDPVYKQKLAKSGMLRGTLRGTSNIKIFGVPPTRLTGPCSRVLSQLTHQWGQHRKRL